MKQILSPFQKYECFEVDGVDYLVVDYTIVQDKDDNLVEWASEMKFKRLKDHKRARGHSVASAAGLCERWRRLSRRPSLGERDPEQRPPDSFHVILIYILKLVLQFLKVLFHLLKLAI